jgi:t-SNARE complex subunit (syntaxin)
MLKLMLIPLKGDFRLDAKTLQHENFIFEIPPLFIRINESVEKVGETVYITDTVKAGNLQNIVQENTQYSDFSVNINVEKVTAYNVLRKFYIVLLYFIIILVILTPIVCFLLFKNEKK